MMRIIAGKWRGRRLEAPAGRTTRPSADRTRETLFSMLVSRLGSLEGLEVLDLFAGSGALGLEALSRGAARCTFVERDRGALAALKANIAALDAEAEILARAVEALGQAPRAHDLVLMDPPYGGGECGHAIARLAERGWFAPDVWIAAETARDEDVVAGGFAIETTRDSGPARLTLLRPARADAG